MYQEYFKKKRKTQKRINNEKRFQMKDFELLCVSREKHFSLLLFCVSDMKSFLFLFVPQFDHLQGKGDEI